VGELYAETPVGNYSLRPHSVLGKIIKQQIIHKPNHTQNPFYKVIERNLNSFLFSLLVTQLLWITTCKAQMRYENFMAVKIMGSGLLLVAECSCETLVTTYERKLS
jgi:hypothetical protein